MCNLPGVVSHSGQRILLKDLSIVDSETFEQIYAIYTIYYINRLIQNNSMRVKEENILLLRSINACIKKYIL